jgi:plasmid stability protein
MISDETERRPLVVRLPYAIKTWLENEAARNDRSQSSEVVRILRACMDNEPKKKAAG